VWSTSLDPELLRQWRAEANRIGGLPDDHPEVPAEYVYTANRLAALIDDMALPTPPADPGGQG
jgi:hypothetical protein